LFLHELEDVIREWGPVRVNPDDVHPPGARLALRDALNRYDSAPAAGAGWICGPGFGGEAADFCHHNRHSYPPAVIDAVADTGQQRVAAAE
jgi:hypothetical protein